MCGRPGSRRGTAAPDHNNHNNYFGMTFVKDITYYSRSFVDSPSQIVEFMQALQASQREGDKAAAMDSLFCVIWQIKEGSQLWVSKAVSDDLRASDLDPIEIKFADVDWPAARLEVYFEDPTISTFLASRTSNAEDYAACLRATAGAPARVVSTDWTPEFAHVPRIRIQAEDPHGRFAFCDCSENEFDEFVVDPDREKYIPVRGFAKRDEIEDLRQLAVLLFKVLLFASSEGHTIRKTRDKPTKKQGGKPGFKNRPVTDRLIVEYLPRHHVERQRAAEAEKKTHQFNGRRGHWRRFRADRYVNLKGKKIFIYPIPGPDGTVPRKKFVVRKLPASAMVTT